MAVNFLHKNITLAGTVEFNIYKHKYSVCKTNEHLHEEAKDTEKFNMICNRGEKICYK